MAGPQAIISAGATSGNIYHNADYGRLKITLCLEEGLRDNLSVDLCGKHLLARCRQDGSTGEYADCQYKRKYLSHDRFDLQVKLECRLKPEGE